MDETKSIDALSSKDKMALPRETGDLILNEIIRNKQEYYQRIKEELALSQDEEKEIAEGIADILEPEDLEADLEPEESEPEEKESVEKSVESLEELKPIPNFGGETQDEEFTNYDNNSSYPDAPYSNEEADDSYNASYDVLYETGREESIEIPPDVETALEDYSKIDLKGITVEDHEAGLYYATVHEDNDKEMLDLEPQE